MKILNAVFALLLVLSFSVVTVNANETDKKPVEANVWTTADGQKHFVCPVMGGEGVVGENTLYTDVDGKRYYHCCNGCKAKFEQNPVKFTQPHEHQEKGHTQHKH